MSDIVAIGRRVDELNASPQFDSYSKVIIHLNDERAIVRGNDTGRTLEITNPFGTQAMANNILAALKGFQYQPYTANGAILNPAAEIGDAANIRGIYGGIYKRNRTFGRLMKADIAAPCDEEINHEYQFEESQKREFRRQLDDVRASLIIANDRIDATVTSTGGNNASFGWRLTTSGHVWYANGSSVMSVTASGLSVVGKITAQSGKIGNFNIGSKGIWNNLSSYGGSQTTGVYIGTDGIQLGQNFKVSTSGRVAAVDMALAGTLTIGGQQITATNLRTGAQQAANNYPSWNGAAGSCSPGGYCYGGATKGNHSYSKARAAQIGNYQLSFGTGIAVNGAEFFDGNGRRCSGVYTNGNVVMAQYIGDYG